MKFLVPDNYTYIEQPIYIEGDRYWIENILVSPTYNLIIARCRQTQPNKEAYIPYNHVEGGYTDTKMTYYETKYDIGDHFIEYNSGWLAIIGIEVYKDDKGFWKVNYETKDNTDCLELYTEEKLYQKELDGKIKYAFNNRVHVEKIGRNLDDVMKMHEYSITEITEEE